MKVRRGPFCGRVETFKDQLMVGKRRCGQETVVENAKDESVNAAGSWCDGEKIESGKVGEDGNKNLSDC